MPKHIVRLLLILGIAGMAASVGKALFTAPTFGEFGHYRAASVPDIVAQKPRFQGPGYCQSCHTERVTFWRKGLHQSVKCEICHGPAAEHPTRVKLAIPADPVSLCGSCHAAMPARPVSSIRQVVIAEHMGTQSCTECHNPHSPAHFTWEDIQGMLPASEFSSSGRPHG